MLTTPIMFVMIWLKIAFLNSKFPRKTNYTAYCLINYPQDIYYSVLKSNTQPIHKKNYQKPF